MLDNDNYSETCHNQRSNATWMHSSSLSMLVHLTYCHRFATAKLVLDDTFDVWRERLVLHKIVVVSYCCWAFGKDRLEMLYPLNTPVKPNDVMRIRANRQNVLVKRLTL